MGVWIETSKDYSDQMAAQSHPAWVCGLKLVSAVLILSSRKSHPAWVCGLKLLVLGLISQ